MNPADRHRRGRRSHGEDYPGTPHPDGREPYAAPGSPTEPGDRRPMRRSRARRRRGFFASDVAVRAGGERRDERGEPQP